MIRNKALNIITYVHVLIPHIERKVDQLCGGYSWPQEFFSLKMEDDFDKNYLLEKSNKYLGFDLIKLDYDEIYTIDDTHSFGRKIDNIKVKDISKVLEYFIKIGKINDVSDSENIKDASYYTLPDGVEMDILNTPFEVDGVNTYITQKIKDYYNTYIFERKLEGDKFVKIDKWTRLERDIKINCIVD